MRTADLIPLILLELNECDKYGFELTKSIETKSKGKIIIKQPTLYTILKKLEKSKFISSYWQDSDIGGKRHYYRITENGKMQVATLPDYEKLIENIVFDASGDQLSFKDDFEGDQNFSTAESDVDQQANKTDVSNANNYSSVSIMDSIIDEPSSSNEKIKTENTISPTLKESIIPSSEVFEGNHIDNATEMEINQLNTQILKNEKINVEEKFAENKDVLEFTKKESTIISDEYKKQFTANALNESTRNSTNTTNEIESSASTSDSLDFDNTYINNEPYKKIKYVDFVDFKTNANYIYAKNTARNMKNRVFASTLYLLVMIIISSVVVSFQSNTRPIYYVSFLIALFILIFYPSIYACFYDRFRMHLQNNKYDPDLKKQLYISLAIEFLIIVVCVIVNVNIGNNTLDSMFSINNFANLYAPILLSTVMFADIIFAYLFIKKSRK